MRLSSMSCCTAVAMRSSRSEGEGSSGSARAENSDPWFLRVLRLNSFRSRIPSDWLLTEIRFVRHVTGDGRVVAEHCIFCHRLARLHRLEKDVEVRTHIVPIVSLINDVFMHGLFPKYRVMLRMPLLHIFLPHLCREAEAVVAGIHVHTGLRRVPQIVFAGIEERSEEHTSELQS